MSRLVELAEAALSGCFVILIAMFFPACPMCDGKGGYLVGGGMLATPRHGSAPDWHVCPLCDGSGRDGGRDVREWRKVRTR